MIVNLPLVGPVEMTSEEHRRYVDEMRRYYSQLPVSDQPPEWHDIREVLEERDAIQAESLESAKERRIFRRVVR